MSIQQQIFEQCVYTLNSIADEPETNDPVCRARLVKACANSLSDAAKGHARYELVRTLNPHQFADLCERNIAGLGTFDDLVDEAMKARAEA